MNSQTPTTARHTAGSKPMTPGYNRTPYKQVHRVMSGEIVNEFGHVICSCDIDVNPSAINAGNGEYLEDVLNSYPAMRSALETIIDGHKLAVESGEVGLCGFDNIGPMELESIYSALALALGSAPSAPAVDAREAEIARLRAALRCVVSALDRAVQHSGTNGFTMADNLVVKESLTTEGTRSSSPDMAAALCATIERLHAINTAMTSSLKGLLDLISGLPTDTRKMNHERITTARAALAEGGAR